MSRLLPGLIVCFFIAVTVLSPEAPAQELPTFVYTNDHTWKSLAPDKVHNTVSGFRVIEGGSLTALPESPYATGGVSESNGANATNTIVVSGQFLYAVNNGYTQSPHSSATVSGFVINATTGVLTTVAGSPFPTVGGVTHGGGGVSLAATPNNAFLIAGTSSLFGVGTLTVFRINQTTGALARVHGSSFAGSVAGLKVSPNGKFLAVGGSSSVFMFTIAANGELAPVSGSPFPINAQSVEFNCKNSLLFSADSNPNGTIVNVNSVDAAGALTPISGSPFIFPGMGVNSNVAILDPMDKLLFVSNQGSDTVSVFNVAASGSLTPVAGSPFPVFGNGIPNGMAVTGNGSFLYVANFNDLVSALSVSATGALTPVSGSPFLVGNRAATAKDVVTYPENRCTVE